MPFTVGSSRDAHRKRKRRFPKEGTSNVSRDLDAKRKVARERESRVSRVINSLLTKWRAHLLSGGSNNSISCAGVKTVVAKLTRKHPFARKRSVFVDLGSGAGIPCIYVALRFGVRCIGIEKCQSLVDLAEQFATKAGVAHLCRFVCADVCSLDPQWYVDEAITHVFAFDARFGEAVLEKMYANLERVELPLVGCSPISSRRHWPSTFVQIGGSSRSLKMTGRGASSFKFGVWSQRTN